MAAQVALRRQQQARDNLRHEEQEGETVIASAEGLQHNQGRQKAMAAYQRRLRNFQRHRLQLTQTRISVTQDLHILNALPSLPGETIGKGALILGLRSDKIRC